MKEGEYAVFKCPNCGCYTFAPTSQKSRFCSRCGKIVKVDLLHAEITNDARRASELVRSRNAKKAPPELKKALRESFTEAEKKTPKKGARTSSLLMKILMEHCSEEVTLDELEKLCTDYGLDCEWVKEKLPQLALKGVVFFPSPWTVKCTAPSLHRPENQSEEVSSQTTNLNKLVIDAFSVPTSRVKVVEWFAEKGYSPEKVDEIIDKLHRSGLIIEEKPGIFKKVE
ncbi:MAG: DUF1922 domain-containing protein [Candidatus Jordarchaeales archaeon]